MIIEKALFVKGNSAFYFDDQRAIKQGAEHDGFVYNGKPVTTHFRSIRKAGECVSIMLILSDGQIAFGDCAAVQYSGVGGRDPLFLASRYIPFMEKHIRPQLEGMKISTFKKMTTHFEQQEFDNKRLHTAIRYGLSQALLDSRAKMKKKLKCEIICEEYKLPVITKRIPVFGQSGDDRYINADKMILKEVDVLPHALINNIEEKLGRNGEKLAAYIDWLVQRIDKLRHNKRYKPDLHIDVYGTIGILYNYDIKKIADYLAKLGKHAKQHNLYIEGPVDMEGKPKEIEALKAIKDELSGIGSPVKIVADEWCNTFEDIKDFCDADACHMVQIKTPDLGGIQNTIESVLYCKKSGMEAYQGGTCNETDISAKTCVHVACATRPERILAKPGMGFDEGYTIVNNEINRIIEVLKNR